MFAVLLFILELLILECKMFFNVGYIQERVDQMCCRRIKKLSEGKWLGRVRVLTSGNRANRKKGI